MYRYCSSTRLNVQVIQGYAVQIFADVFTPGRSRGVKEGEAVDKVNNNNAFVVLIYVCIVCDCFS